MVRLQFVGCGDAFGSGGRFNTCLHLTGDRTSLLMDCGASSVIALKKLGIDRNLIEPILVTHFHADHFGGRSSCSMRFPKSPPAAWTAHRHG